MENTEKDLNSNQEKKEKKSDIYSRKQLKHLNLISKLSKNNQLEEIKQKNKVIFNRLNDKFSYLKKNIYFNNPPKFEKLAEEFPNFKPYVYQNKNKGYSIKWNNKFALKELNKILLKKDFGINYWDIPDGFLIPTLTSRINYICWIKSLLENFNTATNLKDKDILEKKEKNKLQNFEGDINIRKASLTNKSFEDLNLSLEEKQVEKKLLITGIDIGTGANCIYPLIGYSMYNWHFIASDINKDAIKIANENIIKNNLADFISLEKQENINSIFYSVIKPKEIYSFSICNPPYFDISEEKEDNPHTVF